jgi:Uma2 family endonuclease
MPAQANRAITVEEYLAFEEGSDTRHEYYDGQIVALAGGNETHALLCSTITALLYNQLRQRPCTVYTSDLKVKAEQSQKYMYPDLSIVCGKPVFESSSRRVLLNPIIIIEVLSESTESFDRGKKFQYYQSIASVQEYVLVAQDARHIDHYRRQSDHLWLLSSLGVEHEQVHLPSINCTLSIEQIYEKVEFTVNFEDT